MLFLDEPTLGLDVSMQARLRSFVADYNRRTGATVILTSHYMADVVALCPRVILIHHGRLLYDGALAALARRLAPFKLLKVTLDTGSLPDGAYPLPARSTWSSARTATLRCVSSGAGRRPSRLSC